MKIQILNKNKEKLKFKISDIDNAFASELRNIMISEIPILSIEWVDFHRNDSVVWNEILANRLGLIPLSFKPNTISFKDSCKCKEKGCVKCQVKFSLKKKGPCIVYSGDLKSNNKDVKPIYNKIPITELNENQELDLEAYAEMGIGKTHAKWQGAIVGFRNLAKISVNDCKSPESCVDICPKKVFEIKEKKLKVKDVDKCNLCMDCVENCSDCDLKVELDQNKFLFQVERACGLTLKDIIITAFDCLSDKLTIFSKEIERLK